MIYEGCKPTVGGNSGNKGGDGIDGLTAVAVVPWAFASLALIMKLTSLVPVPSALGLLGLLFYPVIFVAWLVAASAPAGVMVWLGELAKVDPRWMLLVQILRAAFALIVLAGSVAIVAALSFPD